jgi:hypothetical protein
LTLWPRGEAEFEIVVAPAPQSFPFTPYTVFPPVPLRLTESEAQRIVDILSERIHPTDLIRFEFRRATGMGLVPGT